MAKIEITWTVTVTDTYHELMDFDDFAAMVSLSGQEPPALEEIRDGDFTTYDLDPDMLAGSEIDPDTADVTSRDVDSIKVIDS